MRWWNQGGRRAIGWIERRRRFHKTNVRTAELAAQETLPAAGGAIPARVLDEGWTPPSGTASPGLSDGGRR
jgi:hypothetical protein